MEAATNATLDPGASTAAQQPTIDANQHLLELELLHAFMNAMEPQVNDPIGQLWLHTAPKLGLKCEYLRHGIFSLGAMYIAHQNGGSDEYLKHAQLYFNLTLRIQRELMTTTDSKYDPLSLFLSYQLVNILTLKIYRLKDVDADFVGNNTIFWISLCSKMRYLWERFEDSLDVSELGSVLTRNNMFSASKFDARYRKPFAQILEFLPDTESMNEEDRKAYNDAAAWIGGIYKVIETVEDRAIADTALRRFLMMPALVPPRFIELTVQQRPRALALISYHFASLKAMRKVSWWIEGLAEYHTASINSLLADEWKPLTTTALIIANGPSNNGPKLWTDSDLGQT